VATRRLLRGAERKLPIPATERPVVKHRIEFQVELTSPNFRAVVRRRAADLRMALRNKSQASRHGIGKISRLEWNGDGC
jgi:hypothetical protein